MNIKEQVVDQSSMKVICYHISFNDSIVTLFLLFDKWALDIPIVGTIKSMNSPELVNEFINYYQFNIDQSDSSIIYTELSEKYYVPLRKMDGKVQINIFKKNTVYDLNEYEQQKLFWDKLSTYISFLVVSNIPIVLITDKPLFVKFYKKMKKVDFVFDSILSTENDSVTIFCFSDSFHDKLEKYIDNVRFHSLKKLNDISISMKPFMKLIPSNDIRVYSVLEHTTSIYSPQIFVYSKSLKYIVQSTLTITNAFTIKDIFMKEQYNCGYVPSVLSKSTFKVYYNVIEGLNSDEAKNSFIVQISETFYVFMKLSLFKK